MHLRYLFLFLVALGLGIPAAHAAPTAPSHPPVRRRVTERQLDECRALVMDYLEHDHTMDRFCDPHYVERMFRVIDCDPEVEAVLSGMLERYARMQRELSAHDGTCR